MLLFILFEYYVEHISVGIEVYDPRQILFFIDLCVMRESQVFL